jgi:Flp pilus assembly protein TadG
MLHKSMRNGRRDACPGRRGVLALELLFVFPVILVVLLATVEFSMMLIAEQQLLIASREGARVAAQGGGLTDIQTAVQTFLGNGNLSQASISAILTDQSGAVIPSGSPVAVSVRIPATKAVPDLLAFVGVTINGQTLIGTTAMRKE